jgi:hypothetical protein
MLPPLPELASPVVMVVMPELPLEVVPVVKWMAPLTPAAPALLVSSVKTPEVVCLE